MKATAKKILSFVIVACLAFIGVFTAPIIAANAAEVSYEETSFGVGQLLITTTDNTTNKNKYYLPTDEATSAGPAKVTFDDVSDISDAHLWTVTAADTDGEYYIQNSAGKYLYTTASNGGVRVSTTKGTWKYDSSAKSLQYTGTDRYLGVYVSGSDWRSYTSATHTNYSGTGTNFTFYKVAAVVEKDPVIQEAVNQVESYMSLAYTYTQETVKEVTDTLNRESTGVTSGSTSYKDWEYKAESGVEYKGQSAGSNDAIQLRSSNNNSGIVTTVSGGTAKKIVLTWTGTSNGRTLNVYGKNTAYAAATDLYSTNTQGTLLGTIVCGTSTELTIEGDYAYIGLRSNSGAMYLSEIQITWGNDTEQVVLKGSEFRIRCGVDVSLSEIENLAEYGIRVTAGEKSKEYTNMNNADLWAEEDTENGKVLYMVINLQDIINEIDKLGMAFTVKAYAKDVNGATYECENGELTKTYSVAGMVEKYYGMGEKVGHLYNYLVAQGLIVVEEVA